VSVCLCL